jgi:hypothetical protein
VGGGAAEHRGMRVILQDMRECIELGDTELLLHIQRKGCDACSGQAVAALIVGPPPAHSCKALRLVLHSTTYFTPTPAAVNPAAECTKELPNSSAVLAQYPPARPRHVYLLLWHMSTLAALASDSCVLLL